MWWRDDNEPRLAEEIARVTSAWHRGTLPDMVAVGSTWTPKGCRTLFVGIDAARDPRPWSWAPGRTLADALARELIRRFGPLPPHPPSGDRGLRATLEQLLRLRGRGDHYLWQVDGLFSVPLEEADTETRARLRQLDVSPHARVGYFEPMRLIAEQGLRLFSRATTRKATAGCLLETDDGELLTTAGHLGAQVGEGLFLLLHRLLFGDRRQPAGRVEATTSPEAPDPHCARCGLADGVDLALVRPEGDGPYHRLAAVELGDARQLMDRQSLCWKGGMTGRREGWVSSLLTELRMSEEGQMPHRNTLRVMVPHSGAAREGDSGTAVYTRRGELIGYLVGVEGYRHRGLVQSALVQDARTAHAYVEHRAGRPIRGIRGDRGC